MLRLLPKLWAVLAGTLLLTVPPSAHAETPGEMLVPRADVTLTRRTVGTVTRTNQADARFDQVMQINVVSCDSWIALVQLTPGDGNLFGGRHHRYRGRLPRQYRKLFYVPDRRHVAADDFARLRK